MRNERGTSLVGLMVAIGIAGLILLSTAAWSIFWLAGERMRDALYDVQTYAQLTRVEAIKRNNDCRLVLDTSTRTLQVLDGQRTPSLDDDVLLHETRLSEVVAFSRPEPGEPVTLQRIGDSTRYQVVFSADGSVANGWGDVVIFAGERYGRVQVAGAGGVSVQRWNGRDWLAGS